MKKFKKQNTTKVALFAGATALMALTQNTHAQSSVDALLNKLEQKGVLTVDEAKELKAENETNSVADFNKAMNSKFPTPDWVTSYKLSGDFRGRYDEQSSDNPAIVERDRLRYRIQLSTDAHASYKGSVGLVFGGDVDWAQIIKEYKSTNIAPGRYSPPACTGVRVKAQLGDPDLAKASTSYIERQNLTMRMHMRRYTRLTNAFSQTLESHAASVALHFMAYNFVRPHRTLANPYPRTPAMAAGVADHLWTMTDIAELLD